MRYYTYISDAKVDMILPQVPTGVREKVAAELGFNLGFISGKLGSETQTLETRVARLGVVERYILETETIGTPSQPAKWIRGQVPMSAMDIWDGCLFFLGEGDNWILALAGSKKHLAGAAAPETVSVPFSFLPDIASILSRWTETQPEMLDAIPERLGADSLAAGISQGAKAWLEIIVWCSGLHERSLKQTASFLAKRLLSDQYAGINVVLASPLYVEVLD